MPKSPEQLCDDIRQLPHFGKWTTHKAPNSPPNPQQWFTNHYDWFQNFYAVWEQQINNNNLSSRANINPITHLSYASDLQKYCQRHHLSMPKFTTPASLYSNKKFFLDALYEKLSSNRLYLLTGNKIDYTNPHLTAPKPTLENLQSYFQSPDDESKYSTQSTFENLGSYFKDNQQELNEKFGDRVFYLLFNATPNYDDDTAERKAMTAHQSPPLFYIIGIDKESEIHVFALTTYARELTSEEKNEFVNEFLFLSPPIPAKKPKHPNRHVRWMLPSSEVAPLLESVENPAENQESSPQPKRCPLSCTLS